MKSRPILFKPELLDLICQGNKTQTRRLDRRWLSLEVGDELWCKEKLVRNERRQSTVEWVGDIPIHIVGKLAHWAKYDRDKAEVKTVGGRLPWRWAREAISPMFMPKAAARVFLEVVEKPRLERVSDITDSDAKAEGFVNRDAFWRAWQSIHGDGGHIVKDVQVVVITLRVKEIKP